MLADPRVREAIDLALDRAVLRADNFGVDPDDQNPPIEFLSGPFVQSSPYYNRTISIREAADLHRSAQLMTEAGAKRVEGRWLVNGEPVVLEFAMEQTTARRLPTGRLKGLAEQLQRAGFGLEYRDNLDSEDWVRAVKGAYKDDLDMILGSWSFGMDDRVGAIFRTRGEGRGNFNLFDWSDPETDRLLDQGRQADEDAEITAAMQGLHGRIHRARPYLFLWKYESKSAWSYKIKNNAIHSYYYFQEFGGWRVDADWSSE